VDGEAIQREPFSMAEFEGCWPQRHAQQVVGPSHILARGVDPLHVPVRAFAQPADAFGPAENLLDAPPHDQAGFVAAALGGASDESCHLLPFDLRAVRGDSALAAAFHEFGLWPAAQPGCDTLYRLPVS